MFKKYWDFYEKPMHRDEFFLIPEYSSGFCLISPEYNSLNSKINNHLEQSGFSIIISELLESKLKNISGEKWTLPIYVKTHKKLLHESDIVVIPKNKKEYIAPFLQSNAVWIFD